jgi:hypothetical protein
MPTAACQANINNLKSFPACTDDYCNAVSFAIGVHCSKSVPPLNPDTPIGPQQDPNLNGPGKPGFCYCCCSCFAGNTPIEATPGQFTLARDIHDGDEILAAGVGLQWKPATVEQASTWGADTAILAMYFVRYRYADGEESEREVIVSPDHLFLMEDGKLLAVQNIVAGMKMRRADGGTTDVLLVVKGTSDGGISSISMEGGFDGKNLDGHLLNSNGVVSADFKVQVYYESARLSKDLLSAIPKIVNDEGCGTAAFHETNPNAAYTAFVEDPAQWPKDFTPELPRAITPPATARTFFTKLEAAGVRKNAPRGSTSNTYPIRAVLYLFREAQGFYPDITFMVDWENKVPNAYTWTDWGKRYVLVTGGLIRVTTLLRDGLSLIVSAMISHSDPDVRCVGEADYNGVAFVMHNLWNDDLFVTVVQKALPQIETLFSYVDKDHSGGDPEDPCADPSLACRLSAYQAALSLFPIPNCALPKPDYFEVKDARADGKTKVNVTFSRDLDAPSAQTIANYTFDPETKVTAAALRTVNPAQVTLTVAPLEPATSYVLTVNNVVSNDGVSLDPKHNKWAFRTK